MLVQPSFRDEWWEQARRQDGVVSRAQLISAGVGPSAVDRMVAGEQLRAEATGVFVVRGAPLTYRARLWIAVLVTDGRLGFGTAARLWGTVERVEDPIDVVVPHARRVYPPRWVRVHRVPVPAYAEAEIAGLPVTSRACSLMDYLPTLRGADRTRLADRAVQRGWLTRADIGRRLFEHPGRTGNVALRLISQQIGDGAAAQSERLLHALLRDVGVVGWIPNYPLWLNGRLVAVLDVAIPQRRLALEVDGWAFHTDVERFQRDRSRQNELVMAGWTVLRFTWADLTEHPDRVRALLRRAC